MGHATQIMHKKYTNAQKHKCTNSCSRLIKSSVSLIKLHICVMVVAQLFEVTLVADGSKLSSKRVSKLSRKYHLHKKQLRQSAMMMAEGLSDAAAAAAAADGGNDDDDSRELSPKRVSKLSRKFHLHKK
jgi:hypothetical protein